MTNPFEAFLVCKCRGRELCPVLYDKHIEGTAEKALPVFKSKELAQKLSDAKEDTVIVQFNSTTTLVAFLEHQQLVEGVQCVALDPPLPRSGGLITRYDIGRVIEILREAGDIFGG